jgi:hypothetical protein
LARLALHVRHFGPAGRPIRAARRECPTIGPEGTGRPPSSDHDPGS